MEAVCYEDDVTEQWAAFTDDNAAFFAEVLPALVAAACLVTRMAVPHPALDRRAAAIIAGGEVAPSRLHLAYAALEVVKVLALVTAGALF